MTSRLCTINDVPGINNVVRTNPSMYGLDITQYHNGIINNFKDSIISSDNRIPVCYEIDNQIVGVVLQVLWKDMPFWSAGSLFIDQQFVQGILFTETVKICHDMLNFMLENAENKSYNDYISVVRESVPGSRDKFLSEKFKIEYHINNIGKIPPNTIPDFGLYRKLLAFTCGKNTKPLVIRHASRKSEFRV